MRRVAIIGCGLIGEKRAASLDKLAQIVVAADVDSGRAEALAKKYGALATTDWRSAATHPDTDVVIVAVTHDKLAAIAEAAAMAGKHILLEKPGARRPDELEKLERISHGNGVKIHVGFNHRFHPAMQKAKELIDEGVPGPLYFIRGRYGHGGRLGYEKEWRADPEIGGGGELLDQGAHLIDLCHWYFQETFKVIHGTLATYFWNMPVEDNAFLTLRTETGRIADLHATWTEWKNLFSLEITGRDAKLHIEGLGGSYGTERLTVHRMKPEMGPPDTIVHEFPGADHSWQLELEWFLGELEDAGPCDPGIVAAKNVLSVVESVYVDNNVPWAKLEKSQP